MKSTPLRRIAFAGLTGGMAALGVLGLLLALNAEEGFANCTATTGAGWVLPLVSGVLVLGLAWSLSRGGHARTESRSSAHHACEACGGTVFGDWRMCPHCGQRFSECTDDGICR